MTGGGRSRRGQGGYRTEPKYQSKYARDMAQIEARFCAGLRAITWRAIAITACTSLVSVLGALFLVTILD